MHKLVFFIAILLSYPGISQVDSAQLQNDILKCSRFRKGIYKSFDEFKANRPTITREFKVLRSSPSKRILLGTSEIKPMYVDANGKLSRVEKKIWGFCDGDTIYIALEKSVYSNEYFKLFHLGKYSLFSGNSSLSSRSGGIIRGALGNTLSNDIGAINYLDGAIIDLDEDLTLELLAPNTILHDQYFKESQKEDKIVEYLTKFNQWYRDNKLID